MTAISSALAGRTIFPSDPAYDDLRRPWNLAVDQRPAAIAIPQDAEQLGEVVASAADAGLRVSVRGGGHNPGPLGDLSDTVLVLTGALSDIVVDPVRRRARVGAGVLWGPVVDATAPFGLYPLHGSSPDVGVVGYSLAGGLSWVARRHGLQANRITAVELVTAAGLRTRVDANHDRDLFWALRGGGGSFGAVTALEFELLSLRAAYAGWLAWDWTHSEAVLTRWGQWAHDAPDSVTTAARILRLPPLPEIPEPLRGRNLVVIDGAVLGDADAAAGLLAPLCELKPEIDTFATVPAERLARLHGDPEQPTPVVADGATLGGLDEHAVRALVEAAGPDSGTQLVTTELRQLGGALARPAAGGGALASLAGAFALFTGTVAPDDAAVEQGRADTRSVVHAMVPWLGGRPLPSFTERALDPAAFYPAATYARLREIRAAVDPRGVFHANHDIAAVGV